MRIMYQIVTCLCHYVNIVNNLTSFDGDPVGNLEGAVLKLSLVGLDVGV